MLFNIILQIFLFISIVTVRSDLLFPGEIILDSLRLYNYEECSVESSTGEIKYGACELMADCSSSGGIPNQSCDNASTTCCTYENGCGVTTNAKVSYFEGIPKASTDSQMECDYTVKFYSPDICQIRLDFENFQLEGPTTTANSSKCDVDKMQISPNIFNIPSLCGNNEGQHVYIHVNQKEVVTYGVQLSIFLAGRKDQPDLLDPKWNIKVTQLECPGSGSEAEMDFDMLAPVGVIQYFTDLSGTVRTFGFDKQNKKNSYTDNEEYAIAFKRDSHVCGVRFTVTYLTLPGTRGADNLCTSGYMFVPGLIYPTSAATLSRICSSVKAEETFTSTPPGPLYAFFRSFPYQAVTSSPNAFNLKYELMLSC